MSVDMNDPVIKEIISARVNLLFRKPFFGNLIARLEIVDASSWCKTAATDGRRFYYNREFIKGLTKPQLIFLLGHEILHCVYDHLGRRSGREPALWNMANDYIVNWTLKQEDVGEMPPNGLISDQFTDEMTSEEVYQILLDNSVEIKATLDEHLESAGDPDDESEGGEGEMEGDGLGKPSEGGEDGDKKVKMRITGKDGKPKLTEDDINSIRNEMKAAIMQAAQAVDAGKVPAGIRRLIQELTESKIDWRTLLEVHIQSTVKDDYTFRRFSRKTWGMGGRAILPGQDWGEEAEVFVWIDASGSIDEQMLRDFLGETKGIMETFSTFKLHLATFDTQAYNYQIFTHENLEEINEYDIGGGGGTDFMAMYEFMKEEEIEPEKMVVFTDGYPCGSWGEEEYCPDVLWVIHYDDSIEVPFGQKVLYNTDGNRGFRF